MKYYHKRCVVNGVELKVGSGEVVGLLGPNGAGKTTTFYMIVGLIGCDEGQIFFNDEPITDYAMHRRARIGIGYLPQEASVFRGLSVLENLLAVLETRKLPRKQRLAMADKLVEDLNISHVAHNKGYTLSGGERRRAEIARALAMEPAFMLLDEPFAGIDPISILDIQRIIVDLCSRNIGVLITDHNVRETFGICSRSYILNEGRVIAEGKPEALLDNPLVRTVYLGESFQM